VGFFCNSPTPFPCGRIHRRRDIFVRDKEDYALSIDRPINFGIGLHHRLSLIIWDQPFFYQYESVPLFKPKVRWF
jgi:hypothetical protein